MENNMAPLRNAAPNWTLAGDKQLLDILQNIHQSLMTRCQEVNRRLDEMVTALDGASVDLQNVNNKFMALSNDQFIESRVYDDDVDVTEKETTQEVQPPSSSPPELASMLAGVRVLQSCHEPVRICDDSDSSDTDDDVTSVVLRPKVVYPRPLPHIIGTAAWRNKWHAGLQAEDSDSDSTTSKPEAPDEEYSDSEPEAAARLRNDHTETDCQGSTTSSEVFSEQDVLPPAKPSPADVAAELARRLRGEPTIPEEDTDFVPPQPAVKKVYRPEQPATGTIFSDEPPPFEDDQSEEEEEDDIFAELHKKPYTSTNKVQNSSVVEDLFGGIKSDTGNVFSDLVYSEPPPLASNQKSTLFEDESEPELFTSKPTNIPIEHRNDNTAVAAVKKPVGGISLFGSNKDAESIGAAILKRNRRKSSSDEDSSNEESEPIKTEEKSNKATAEKDIFDDLFAKSEKEQRPVQKKVEVVKKETTKKEVKTDRVDLFSDNLFEDIDDIFTADVKVITKSNDKQKSIFDDSDDDLFANIAVTNNLQKVVKIESKSKSIFDSDDELFSDNVNTKDAVRTESDSQTSDRNVSSKNDDDGVDDILNKLSENKINSSKISNKIKVTRPNSDENPKTSLVINNESRHYITNNNIDTVSNADTIKETPPLLCEDDDNDIFSISSTNASMNKSTASSSPKLTENSTTDKSTKTSLFGDDDDDDLFTSSIKSSTKDNFIENTTQAKVKEKTNNDYNIFDPKIKNSDSKENMPHIYNEEKVNDDIKNRNEVPQSTTSLFDDNHDENDSLFADLNSSNTETSITNKSIARIPSPVHSKPDKNETPYYSKKNKRQSETKLRDNEKLLESITVKIIQDKNIDKENVKSDLDSNDIPDLNSSDISDSNTFLETVKNVVFNAKDDIFSDLIVEPPAFEKPKEPKKSKNVNALFDDDSDDEALFFKKNDATFDDKPNANIVSNNDTMFGIFHDEPPAIDIDFTTSSNKSTKNYLIFGDNLFKTVQTPERQSDVNIKENNNHNISTDIGNELFKNIPPSASIAKESQLTGGPESLKDIDHFFNSDSDNDLFHAPKTQKPTVTSKPPLKDIQTTYTNEQIKKYEDIESSKTQPLSPKESSSDTPDSPETKKIGKLKSMNFNIDVSTLLPGASPKKKSLEQTDGQVYSAKSQEDLHTKENVEQTILKSVSFEGEPDSQILDNKISKERAKIQVKRRPSTRRARKEAVRKSVLDLGDDSTDNSSSFDDVSKTEEMKTEPKPSNNKGHIVDNVEPKQVLPEEQSINKTDVLNCENDRISKTSENVNTDNEANSTKTSEINIKHSINNENNLTVEIDIETKSNIPSKSNIVSNNSKTVKSKVVYILNDEDIFNTPVEKPTESTKSITNDDTLFTQQNENIYEGSKKDLEKSIDDETLFSNSDINEGSSISTLGKVYKEKKQEKNIKKSLFDDLSDEENELFNTNKKIRTKPKGILDSDSEDELFFGKRDKIKDVQDKVGMKETLDVKLKAKASLFGDDDDDDDDDLFGAKVKIDQVPSQPVRSTRDVVVKPAEPVSYDPLSLLGNDDE